MWSVYPVGLKVRAELVDWNYTLAHDIHVLRTLDSVSVSLKSSKVKECGHVLSSRVLDIEPDSYLSNEISHHASYSPAFLAETPLKFGLGVI